LSKQIAITGASGLVGSHLVEFLGARGYPVKAIVRSSNSVAPFLRNWQERGVEICQSDVTSPASLFEAFQNADVVVHAAGIVDPYGKRKDIFNTNVEGTKNAVMAAQHNKVKQFIFISSLSVITGRHDQFNTKEDAPYQESGEAYADSKIKAERLVRAAIEKDRFPATILRPGFIYGPREKAWLPRLINSITTGKAMLIDGGLKETNVVYVENVSRAIAAAIEQPASIGQIYNLTDGPGITKKELFDTLSAGLALPRVEGKVSGVLARAFCEFISTIAPILPVDTQRKLARYSRAAFRLVGQNQGFSIQKAERDLGYGDRVPFAQGMEQTLMYFRSLSAEREKKDSPEKLLAGGHK
jgi:2-alkyl-3-oxoalkanoate reductase